MKTAGEGPLRALGDIQLKNSREGPLRANQELACNRTIRADGCADRLVNGNGELLLKAYRLDTNISLRYTGRRCPGHGTTDHGSSEHEPPGKLAQHPQPA